MPLSLKLFKKKKKKNLKKKFIFQLILKKLMERKEKVTNKENEREDTLKHKESNTHLNGNACLRGCVRGGVAANDYVIT